ncbi:hypothetical protein FSP39_024327 [Pinctada imbricata]|uniref:Bacterial surface antigen (D15) domain-containing protein n=1 Tax=Pinctada imbricata TaxID=66713 RepID=A0AA89CBM8_PINIB|nr:hypothetical protein FSP39_024327 [Pinctada imbricata]
MQKQLSKFHYQMYHFHKMEGNYLLQISCDRIQTFKSNIFFQAPQFVPGWKDAKAKVSKIIVEGVGRTKDDIIKKVSQQLYNANSLEEIAVACRNVKQDFLRLNLFRDVEIKLDTAKEKNAPKNSYNVIFNVKEKKRFTGGVNAEVGNNETGIRGKLQLPNTFGRGEVASLDWIYNLVGKDTGGGLRLTKPLGANPDILLTTGYSQYLANYPWSGFKESSKGFTVDLKFPSVFGDHTVAWEGTWRDLRAATRTTSYDVREQAGHSLKSGVKHTFVRDERDDKILPTTGVFIKTSQEFAGLGGNVEFFKNEVELQLNRKLIFDTSIQLSLAGGVMKGLGKEPKILINDKFFLGGPQTLRGFETRGVGPSSEGNSLGGTAYWLAGAHLFSPLPFRLGKGGFGELFRSHAFVNAGNLGEFHTDKTTKENLQQLSDTFRLAFGLGVVLRLGGIARLELNYVFPVRYTKGDK